MITSDYINLGDIIAALEAEDPMRVLPLGFHDPHSYRGYYEQLAFAPAWNITIGEMLAAAKSAVGATFEGWKGGEYVMSENADCWIANRGDTSDNKIGPMLLRLLLSQGRQDLAELVAALRKLVVLLHNDHLHDDDFEQCEEHHCELRALLAKHEGAAT